MDNCVNGSLRNNLCWSTFVLSKWSVEVSKARCVNDLAKVDETGTGRRGLVLCTHVLYPNANTCPCAQESLYTQVLHSGPGEKRSNAIKDTQVATSLPSDTPKQLSMSSLPGLPPFQNIPCRLGRPQRKTKVWNLEFCFNHTHSYIC